MGPLNAKITGSLLKRGLRVCENSYPASIEADRDGKNGQHTCLKEMDQQFKQPNLTVVC